MASGEHGVVRAAAVVSRAGEPARVGTLVMAFWVAVVALSLASWAVVFKGASDEPYFGGERTADRIVQVHGGMGLIGLWALTGLASVWLVCRRRVHGAALLVLLWGIVCSYYLWEGARGYLSDVARYRALGDAGVSGVRRADAPDAAAAGGFVREEPPRAWVWAFNYEADGGGRWGRPASFDPGPNGQDRIAGEVVAYTEEGARTLAGMRVRDWVEARNAWVFFSGTYFPLDHYANAVNVRRVSPAGSMEPLSHAVAAGAALRL